MISDFKSFYRNNLKFYVYCLNAFSFPVNGIISIPDKKNIRH